MKTKNVYNRYTKEFDKNFGEIYFPNYVGKESVPAKNIDMPKCLKMNIIEIRRNNETWDVYIHIWYKCLFYANYESKQGAKNAAETIQQKYLQNFKIIIEDSFF